MRMTEALALRLMTSWSKARALDFDAKVVNPMKLKPLAGRALERNGRKAWTADDLCVLHGLRTKLAEARGGELRAAAALL